MKKVSYNGLTFKPYIEYDQIQSRIAEVTREIERDCQGKLPLIVCVLNGAFPFASEIFMNLEIDAEIAFIRYKSYEGTGSTGSIRELLGIQEDIKGRTVIVVEDIVDTGRTIDKLLKDLRAREPETLKVATLLYKPAALQCDVKPDYVGFEIPSKFIIGYGLDLDGLGRNLKDIYVLDEEGA